jgi:signal peptide peptidase SppA
MSKKKYEYWLIDPESLEQAEIVQVQAFNEVKEVAKSLSMQSPTASEGTLGFWGDPRMAWLRPYDVQDGVLRIPVQGTLLNKFPYQYMSYATGYEYIHEAMKRGMGDEAVEEIALIVDSGGGLVGGCFELVDAIYEMRGDKKITAYVEGGAYSAAYALASAADEVVVARMGGTGSVGVVTTHFDLSAMADKQGIKVTFIYAGKHKVDGNMYESLSDETKKRIQKRIDRTYAVFTETVGRNRDMEQSAVESTEALTFSAEESIELKFADRVGHLGSDKLARQGTDGDENSDEETVANNGDSTMADETKTMTHDQAAVDAAAATAASAAKTAERERFAAVHASAEFAGREALANHLLANTDMAADVIIATLAAAPAPVAATAVADDAAKAKADATATAFDKAMETGNPDIKATGDEVLTDDQVVQTRLGDAMKATAPRRRANASK